MRKIDSFRRLNDSVNLALFKSQIVSLNRSVQAQNKGIDIQNQALEVERLANKSDLQIRIDISKSNIVNQDVSINPEYYLTNTGKAAASNISLQSCFVLIDNWHIKKKNCDCGSPVKFQRLSVVPGTTQKLPNIYAFGRIIESKAKRDSIRQRAMEKFDSLRKPYYYKLRKGMPATSKEFFAYQKKFAKEKDYLTKIKYPYESYKYFLIVNISYQDKYLKQVDQLYSIINLVYSWGHFYSSPAEINDMILLEKCIKDNKFDYRKIYELVKNQTAAASSTVTDN